MPATFRISRFVFLRLLAVCMGCGFLSLWQQAPGLIGSGGITPLDGILDGWRQSCGPRAFWCAPSLFWLASSDAFVVAVAFAGVLASGLLLLGIAPRASCVVGYVCWLSFRAIDGGPVCWFNYPYDDLQTEALFLGIFVAPGTLWPWREPPELPRWVRWLMLWFLFRVMFGPGITKVLWHGPWRELTAVGDFLLTMPHPTPVAAVCRELPPLLLLAMTAFTLACELLGPFLFLVPGRPRRLAVVASIGLMLGIQLVCNIRGFQLLTVGLLLLLWDDAAWWRLVPGRWRRLPGAIRNEPVAVSWWRRLGAAVVIGLSVGASMGPFLSQFGWSLAKASPTAGAMAAAVEPFRIASCYTMFSIVPDQRPGFVVQGSDDGVEWSDYELLGIPARVDREPAWFAPFHDYLGFKLWFAAFCPPEQDGWLLRLQQRLLAGDPGVQRLFDRDPFAGRAPKWVRIPWFRFEFAPPEGRAAGQFWRREMLVVRIPAARLPD